MNKYFGIVFLLLVGVAFGLLMYASINNSHKACSVSEPISAATLISAIKSRNVELALSAWDTSYKPTAIDTVQTLIPPNTVTIESIDWFGSCRDSLGDTKTVYVIHILSTENYSKRDIIFIVTTSTREKVKEVNYI